MTGLVRTLATIGLCVSLAADTAQAQSVRVYVSDGTPPGLTTTSCEDGKTVTFSAGIGSGAFRHPRGASDLFYTVSDRRPKIGCGKKSSGVILPPDTPSIHSVQLRDDGTYSIRHVISLKDRDGRPIDNADDKATAIDAEGLVLQSDGSWWIAEETGPGLVHLAADGRILMRLVPAGTEGDFAVVNYPVAGALPAILTRRQGNRGLESIAVSPDERFLYTILQSALANPDKDTFKKARNIRLLKLDRATMRPVAEYVYQLDDPQTFRNDPSGKQSAPRISEMLALGADRLLVLERTRKTTKLHEISLSGATNILASRWDDPATDPSLEATNELAGSGIAPVGKTLRFDSADFDDIPDKLEGMAILGDGSIALINDNDFGIDGAKARIVVLSGSAIMVDF